MMKLKPEVLLSLMLCFIVGAFLVAPAAVLQKMLAMVSSNLLAQVFFGTFFEELLKSLLILLAVEKTPASKSWQYGLFFGAFTGFGFSFSENVFYSTVLYSTASFYKTMFFRMTCVTLMHVSSSAAFGACSAESTRLKERTLLFVGFLVALLLHVGFNVLVLSAL